MTTILGSPGFFFNVNKNKEGSEWMEEGREGSPEKRSFGGKYPRTTKEKQRLCIRAGGEIRVHQPILMQDEDLVTITPSVYTCCLSSVAPGYPIPIPATCLGKPRCLQGHLGPGIPRGTLNKKPSPASHCFLLGTKAALYVCVCVWSLQQGAVPRGVVLINLWPSTKSSAGLAELRN